MTNIPNQISAEELQWLLQSAGNDEKTDKEEFEQQLVQEINGFIQEHSDIFRTQLRSKLAVMMLLKSLMHWSEGNCKVATDAKRTEDALSFRTMSDRFEMAFDLLQCTQVSHDDFTVSDEE